MLINTKWDNRILALEKLCKIWYNINIEYILFYNKFIRRNKMKTVTNETAKRILDASAFVGFLACLLTLIFAIQVCWWSNLLPFSSLFSLGIGGISIYMLRKWIPEFTIGDKIKECIQKRSYLKIFIGILIGMLISVIVSDILIVTYPAYYALWHLIHSMISMVLFYFFFLVLEEEEEE